MCKSFSERLVNLVFGNSQNNCTIWESNALYTSIDTFRDEKHFTQMFA